MGGLLMQQQSAHGDHDVRDDAGTVYIDLEVAVDVAYRRTVYSQEYV